MKKAVFLDRDGTLNPDPGYISDPEKFILFDGIPEALADLKKAGFILILVSNQSGIARGLITFEQLGIIHQKMQNLLSIKNAELDYIYFCPHHHDFPSVEGISDCNCRKPNPGMVLEAAKKHCINLSASYMIGDKSADIELGLNTGMIPVFIGDNPHRQHQQVMTFSKLPAAVEWILKQL